MRALRIDGRPGLLDLPGKVLLDHRVLIDAVALDHEPLLARGRAERSQVAAPLGARRVGGGAAGLEGRHPLSGAVAVDTGDLDGGTDLAVELRVAVHVLDEVAVDAVHAALHVDVEHVHREAVALVRHGHLLAADLLGRLLVGSAVDLLDPLRHLHGRPQGLVARVGDDVSLVVEEVALAVVLEDGAEGPAMAVEITELGVLRAVVQVAQVGEELWIGEEVLRRRLVGIVERGVDHLLRCRIFLFLRVDQLAVTLLVPPHVADVTVHHGRAGMDVADDALAGGNAVARRELVMDRVAALLLRDRGVDRKALAAIAELRVGTGVDRRTVVGVDDMAARAAAGAVVAGMVVGTEEVERWVEQPRLCEADHDRVGAVFGAEAAVAQSRAGPAVLLEAFGVAHLRSEAAAAFEDPQDVAGLRSFEPGQRIEGRDHRLVVHLVFGRRRNRLQPLADAVHAVAFAEAGSFVGDRSVVVEGGVPEHAAVGHHALLHLQHDR